MKLTAEFESGSQCNELDRFTTQAIPGEVFGHALTVYRQQASDLGPVVADIQVVHYHTSRHVTPLITVFSSITDARENFTLRN